MPIRLLHLKLHQGRTRRQDILTLARREGETIILTIDGMEPIKIQLSTIDKRRRQVRIAIEAPEEVEIWREEVFHEDENNNLIF